VFLKRFSCVVGAWRVAVAYRWCFLSGPSVPAVLLGSPPHTGRTSRAPRECRWCVGRRSCTGVFVRMALTSLRRMLGRPRVLLAFAGWSRSHTGDAVRSPSRVGRAPRVELACRRWLWVVLMSGVACCQVSLKSGTAPGCPLRTSGAFRLVLASRRCFSGRPLAQVALLGWHARNAFRVNVAYRQHFSGRPRLPAVLLRWPWHLGGASPGRVALAHKRFSHVAPASLFSLRPRAPTVLLECLSPHVSAVFLVWLLRAGGSLPVAHAYPQYFASALVHRQRLTPSGGNSLVAVVCLPCSFACHASGASPAHRRLLWGGPPVLAMILTALEAGRVPGYRRYCWGGPSARAVLSGPP
jgi:hypothetical protein